jgi:phage tail sheath protein FI
MTTAFLHGVQIQEVSTGARPIQTPPTAVIELVGTAPVHLVAPSNASVNKPTLIQSDRNAAAFFGPDLAGYTIPQALNAILDFGACSVVVINVFDPAIHQASAFGEPITLAADGTATLAHPGIISATVKSPGGEPTIFSAGTDYTLDPATARITRLATGFIAVGASLQVDYTYGDPSQVQNSDITGTTTTAGTRTGLQATLDVVHLFNLKPRILLTPGYCSQAEIKNALIGMADRIKAHAYIDAPIGMTLQQAIESRGPSGALDMTTGSERAVLCYPYVQVKGTLEPYSQNLAGLAASVDLREGFWVSPSNHDLTRIEALERPISWSLSDSLCEANQLNAVGFVTAVRGYGTGFLAWGNRSAAWPTNTDPKSFICVRVVADVLHEAVERAMLPYVDKPLNRAILDAVRESVNTYLTTLIRQGALVGGACTWTPADNPESELALGRAAFQLSFMPPTPMEEVTFTSTVDTAWLANLYQAAA